MLIPQTTGRDRGGEQGRSPVTLADVRCELALPSTEMSSGVRQRLLGLAQRLARVQALGDEYGRVGFSPEAAEALDRTLSGC